MIRASARARRRGRPCRRPSCRRNPSAPASPPRTTANKPVRSRRHADHLGLAPQRVARGDHAADPRAQADRHIHGVQIRRRVDEFEEEASAKHQRAMEDETRCRPSVRPLRAFEAAWKSRPNRSVRARAPPWPRSSRGCCRAEPRRCSSQPGRRELNAGRDCRASRRHTLGPVAWLQAVVHEDEAAANFECADAAYGFRVSPTSRAGLPKAAASKAARWAGESRWISAASLRSLSVSMGALERKSGGVFCRNAAPR